VTLPKNLDYCLKEKLHHEDIVTGDVYTNKGCLPDRQSIEIVGNEKTGKGRANDTALLPCWWSLAAGAALTSFLIASICLLCCLQRRFRKRQSSTKQAPNESAYYMETVQANPYYDQD